MRILSVIPARYGSSRLPGKPLADLGGVPLVIRVWRRVRALDIFEDVVVATDDQRILDAVVNAGGRAELSSPLHPSGSDRVWEVLERHRADGVVNIQGDEPFVEIDVLRRLALCLREPGSEVVSAACPLEGDPTNAARVKVSFDKDHLARDFSREPFGKGPQWLHVGLYAYRREVLRRFVSLGPSPRETTERLEQLRMIENGISIKIIEVERAGLSIDTPEDLMAARALLRAEAGY